MRRILHPGLGPRNVSEFVWGGEVLAEIPAQAPDWAERFWRRENIAGVVREWWFHIPTSCWLIVARDTVTDAQVGPSLRADDGAGHG